MLSRSAASGTSRRNPRPGSRTSSTPRRGPRATRVLAAPRPDDDEVAGGEPLGRAAPRRRRGSGRRDLPCRRPSAPGRTSGAAHRCCDARVAAVEVAGWRCPSRCSPGTPGARRRARGGPDTRRAPARGGSDRRRAAGAVWRGVRSEGRRAVRRVGDAGREVATTRSDGAAAVCRRAIPTRIPTAAMSMTSDVPPKEMNGSGIPVTGRTPVTAPTFTIVSTASQLRSRPR